MRETDPTAATLAADIRAALNLSAAGELVAADRDPPPFGAPPPPPDRLTWDDEPCDACDGRGDAPCWACYDGGPA